MKNKLFLLFLLGHSCLSGTAIEAKNLRLREDDAVGVKRQAVRKKVRANPNQAELKRAAAAKAKRGAAAKAKPVAAQKAKRAAAAKMKRAAAAKMKRAAAAKMKRAAAAKAKPVAAEKAKRAAAAKAKRARQQAQQVRQAHLQELQAQRVQQARPQKAQAQRAEQAAAEEHAQFAKILDLNPDKKAKTFQDPFAKYKTENATSADVEFLAQLMKEVDVMLFPEEVQLKEALLNLRGYNDENKDLYIEGYIAEGEAQGRYITQPQAEQAYNAAKAELKDQIKAGKKARQLKRTPFLLAKYYIISSHDQKKNPAVIANALEMMGVEFPTIKYPEGFKGYGLDKVNATILKKWEDGYDFFQIQPDGLYGRKKQNDAEVKLDDAALEKFLKFEGKKVIEEKQQGNPGIQLFYSRDPEPKEVNIYDNMERDARKFLADNPQMRAKYITLIHSAKEFFRQRPAILARTAKGRYEIIHDYHHAIHVELSDPKSMFYDGVPIKQRLNNVHNAMTRTYLTAKERGTLKDYFKRALPYISTCMDANSVSYQDYAMKQEQGLDKDLQKAIKNISKEQLIARVYDEVRFNNEGELRAGLQAYVGLEIKDGLFDVDELIRVAREELMLIE